MSSVPLLVIYVWPALTDFERKKRDTGDWITVDEWVSTDAVVTGNIEFNATEFSHAPIELDTEFGNAQTEVLSDNHSKETDHEMFSELLVDQYDSWPEGLHEDEKFEIAKMATISWADPSGNRLIEGFGNADTTFRRHEIEREFLGQIHCLKGTVVDVLTGNEVHLRISSDSRLYKLFFSEQVGQNLRANQQIALIGRTDSWDTFRDCRILSASPMTSESFLPYFIKNRSVSGADTTGQSVVNGPPAEGVSLLNAVNSAETIYDRERIRKQLKTKRLVFRGVVQSISSESDVLVDTQTAGHISVHFKEAVADTVKKGQTIVFDGRLVYFGHWFFPHSVEDCLLLSEGVLHESVPHATKGDPALGANSFGDSLPLSEHPDAKTIRSYYDAVSRREFGTAYLLRSSSFRESISEEVFAKTFDSITSVEILQISPPASIAEYSSVRADVRYEDRSGSSSQIAETFLIHSNGDDGIESISVTDNLLRMRFLHPKSRHDIRATLTSDLEKASRTRY